MPEVLSANGFLCETRNVSHEFLLPNGKPLSVLENIDLGIRSNEVMAILGPSGCGKSTLLRILAGLISPAKGDVLYHEEPLKGLNPGVAIVFQSFALYPWLTVTQNIEIVLKAAGMPEEQRQKKITDVIRLVTLTGFESAYPRELSGGMKQRVGIARALSVNPEILFMDEPFSQVDALTAEGLRAEVLDIWGSVHQNPSSIVMVSHDIKEVAYMADRIVLLAANPGRVLKVIENKLPRPRDYRSHELLKLVDQIHDVITGHEMPDVPVPTRKIAAFEPLPDVPVAEIIGLLEYLDARGGTDEVFKAASEMNREFGEVIKIVKAAEMLNFIDTPKKIVILETTGLSFVRANAKERKKIWREEILKLQLFREIYELLQRHPEKSIEADFVLETIAMRIPHENYKKIFNTFINWARFSELFSYDPKAQNISL